MLFLQEKHQSGSTQNDKRYIIYYRIGTSKRNIFGTEINSSFGPGPA